MKTRNLLVLTITMALGTLCAQAQANNGSMTFTDNLGQSVTISRFGTVTSFKDNKGQVNPTENYFRIGPYGNNGPFPWIDSRKGEGTSTALKVEFPKQGTTIGKGQTLVAVATVTAGDLKLERRLTWAAGSKEISVDQTLSASKTTSVGTIDEGVGNPNKLRPPCPPPPGEPAKCPLRMSNSFKSSSNRFELTKQLTISPGNPIHLYFTIGPYASIPPISPG